MAFTIASFQADAVGWICLLVGIAVLGAGVWIGFRTGVTQAPEKAKEKLAEASQKIDEAKEHIERTTAATEGGLESAGPAEAGAAAGSSADAAKSALEQVQGIIGALPENLRFAGVLVLVGTVLMSVATIQFGGTSLF